MDPSTSLILEIQSGLVNAAIVSATSTSSVVTSGVSDPARILHFVSVPITGAPHESTIRLLVSMTAALSQALQSLLNVHAVSRVDCILSSPWIVSRTKSLTVTFPKDTLITKKLIGASIVPEREAMLRSAAGNSNGGSAHSSAGDSAVTELTPIEQKIFEIKINGYPTTDIAGKKGRELGIYFAVSMSAETIIEAIRDTVSRHVSPTVAHRMAYHSSILLGYVASRETTSAETSYILSHIHGELSDIALVEKGITTLIASFPFGYSSLIRETSKALGEPLAATRSKIALHGSKSFHREESERISQTIETIVRERWADEFLKAVTIAEADDGVHLGAMETSRPLPYAIFLAVPGEYYPHFKKALEDRKEKPEYQKKDDGIMHKAHMFIVNHINTGLIHTILKL
jgi:hypothetical protein